MRKRIVLAVAAAMLAVMSVVAGVSANPGDGHPSCAYLVVALANTTTFGEPSPLTPCSVTPE